MPRRFEGPFHQSHLVDYTTCPRQFFFKHIKELAPETVHAARFIGEAAHATIYDIHRLGMYTETEIRERFDRHCRSYREEVAKLNGTLRWHGAPREILDEAVRYLTAYAQKPMNQSAHVLYAEAEWQCKIGKYLFAGRIDQVRKQDGKIILVDFKTSSYRPGEAFLRRSYQLSVYAYALWKVFGFMPDEIWQYHLKDHLPYRRSGAWGKIGDERGPAIYRTERSKQALTYLETDVARICAAIRFGHFYRRPAQLGSCQGFCQYTAACEQEMNPTLLTPTDIEAIEEVYDHASQVA